MEVTTEFGEHCIEYLYDYGEGYDCNILDEDGNPVFTNEQMELIDKIIVKACEDGDYGDSDVSHGIIQAYARITREKNDYICHIDDYGDVESSDSSY